MKESERLMKEMKSQNEAIFMENSKYLKANAKKYLKSIPKSLNNKNQISEDDNDDDEENSQQQIRGYSNAARDKPRPNTDTSSLDYKNQIKNYKYVNGRLRSQLMRAFLKYNPKIHHDNVIKLGEINPDIKQ